MFEATDGLISYTSKTRINRGQAQRVPLGESRPDALEFVRKKSQANPCNQAKPKFTQGKINHSQNRSEKNKFLPRHPYGLPYFSHSCFRFS